MKSNITAPVHFQRPDIKRKGARQLPKLNIVETDCSKTFSLSSENSGARRAKTESARLRLKNV
jgi:hypothetical protein